MALTTKRIIALPSQTDPQEGDYLAIDNATNGTHKIPVGRIGVEVDDTLTEQGKAADAKAVGDALDEIRSQIEVTGTASGSIATFVDGSDNPMKSCIVNIEPKQSGTGTPSPDNVRPISGWESVNLFDTGKNLINVADWEGTISIYAEFRTTFKLTAGQTYTFSATVTAGIEPFLVSAGCGTETGAYSADILTKGNNTSGRISLTFTPTEDNLKNGREYLKLRLPMYAQPTSGTEASVKDIQLEVGNTATPVNLGRTVYGGTLDVVTGVLTAYPFYPSYNGETLNGRWLCDRAVYAEGTTPPTGSQVALISGTGTTYQLTPTEVQTILGENNVWADCGDVEVVYIRDLNLAINNLLNSNGTRSLGMMMSAPTEATAEEPTDEQTEEPAEDDMR